MTTRDGPADPPPVPVDGLGAAARALVLKTGVGLGGLPEAQRDLALSLVWAALPAATVWTEPQVNQQLKAALAGVAAFLDIDHVELRRWLVDGGWLERDGFGRAYQRVEAASMPAAQAAQAAALAGVDVSAWAGAQRAEQAARREARRRAHEAARRAAVTAGGGSDDAGNVSGAPGAGTGAPA